ncbi:unnamed protein product [Mortierella alpina]
MGCPTSQQEPSAVTLQRQSLYKGRDFSEVTYSLLSDFSNCLHPCTYSSSSSTALLRFPYYIPPTSTTLAIDYRVTMGLVGFITFLRYFALLVCAAVFGFDIYFIELYETHNEVAFKWQFFAQTGIISAMILTLVLSEITFRICLYRQRHRKRHYSPDFGEHSPYLAEPSGTGPGGVALPVEPRRRSRGCCSIFWSIIRFCWMWILSAGILHVTIRSFTRQGRSVFVLPFLRDSTPGIYYSEYRNYDPRDLFTCPDGTWFNELSYLCRFDNVATVLAAAAGLLVLVEAVATLIFENRGPRSSKSSSFRNTLATKHRTEPIHQEELANSHVVVVGPQPVELQPYGVYQHQFLQHNSSLPAASPSLTERSLPPLPPRPVLEGDDGAEDIYSAKALPDKKQDFVPNVWASAADEKSNMKEAFEERPEEEPTAYETLHVEDENQAGPSHSYPRDIKCP